MGSGSVHPICKNGNGVPRVCSPMGSDIFLRCNSDYQPAISNSVSRPANSRVDLRGLFCWAVNLEPVFFSTFHLTISNRWVKSSSFNSSS